jgi:replicative DNA helicase
MSEIESRREAADALMGMFIVMPPVLDEAIADHGLRPEHFDLAEHRTLFEALIGMRDQGASIDHPRVTAWIDQQIASARQPWATHGRQHALEMLDAWADSPWLYISRVASLVEILRTEHRWDVRHDALRRGQRAIRDRDDDAFAMALDTAAEADDDVEDEIITAEQLGSEFIDWYQDANTGAIPTPFPRLSEMLAGGWLPGATTIVAAWSSMGKSVLVDQFAAHVTSPVVVMGS